MIDTSYSGASLLPRKESISYACPCGAHFQSEIWRVLGADEPSELMELLRGELNRVRCAACNRISSVEVGVVYHDATNRSLFLVLPDSQRHREFAAWLELMRQVGEDRLPVPDYIRQTQVVFGGAALKARLYPDKSVENRLPEAAPVIEQRPSVANIPAAPVVATQSVPPAPAPAAMVEMVAELPAAAPAVEPPAVAKPTVPVLTPTVVPAERSYDPIELRPPRTRIALDVPVQGDPQFDRWTISRDAPTLFLVGECIFLCVAQTGQAVAHMDQLLQTGQTGDESPLGLRFQLHRLHNYPVVAITLIGDATAEHPRALEVTVPLDVARAAHRVVLETLAKHAQLTVRLYNKSYQYMRQRTLDAPIEENIGRIGQMAKELLSRIPLSDRSFERARTSLLQPAYDRKGRTPIEFPPFDKLPTLGATDQALSAVNRWSQPAAEAYLLEIKCVPVASWRQIRNGIVGRAAELGLFLPRALYERIEADAPGFLPDWNELLAQTLKRFFESVRNPATNDLDAKTEGQYWQALLVACNKEGVSVSHPARERARQVAPELEPSDSMPQAVNVNDPKAMIALLESKSDRERAILFLCKERVTDALPQIWATIGKLNRQEASQVMPALVEFGPTAEPLLLEGLQSKKAFIRQGSALALGALHSVSSVDALLDLLVHEPTEIWREAARALGDLGDVAISPIAGRITSASQEGLDRLIEALGQIGARGHEEALRALLGTPHVIVVQAAERALSIVEEIRDLHDALVQGRTEQTVVRGFSRRFYEGLSKFRPSEADDAWIDMEAPSRFMI